MWHFIVHIQVDVIRSPLQLARTEALSKVPGIDTLRGRPFLHTSPDGDHDDDGDYNDDNNNDDDDGDNGNKNDNDGGNSLGFIQKYCSLL